MCVYVCFTISINFINYKAIISISIYRRKGQLLKCSFYYLMLNLLSFHIFIEFLLFILHASQTIQYNVNQALLTGFSIILNTTIRNVETFAT